MKDHVHILVGAKNENAAALRFMKKWRQSTGLLWKRRSGQFLWQEGYWDYVLRANEDPMRVAAYIINNPIRAGICESIFDYPYVGSSVYTLQQLKEAIQLRVGGGRD